MKTQAWGWLTAALLAAGLNSSYHNGGMQWAHEIVDRVGHNTGAVLALATGRADQFLAEARMLNVERHADREASQCPFTATMAQVERSFDQSQAQIDRFQALSDREQARLARIEASRARIEARVQARLARVQFAENGLTDSGLTMTSGNFADNGFRFTGDHMIPVTVQVPRIHCPHVRVVTPRIPRVRVTIPRIDIPAPVVEVDNSGPGPI